MNGSGAAVLGAILMFGAIALYHREQAQDGETYVAADRLDRLEATIIADSQSVADLRDQVHRLEQENEILRARVSNLQQQVLLIN
jgi:hypothetical protein